MHLYLESEATVSPENARVQEDAASADLPDLEHDAAQLRAVVGHLPHLLLRVRGAPLGHRQTGGGRRLSQREEITRYKFYFLESNDIKKK